MRPWVLLSTTGSRVGALASDGESEFPEVDEELAYVDRVGQEAFVKGLIL